MWERRKDTGLESEHLAFSPVYTNAARVALAHLFNFSVLRVLIHQIRVIIPDTAAASLSSSSIEG